MKAITRLEMYELVGLDHLIKAINDEKLPVGKYADLVKIKGDDGKRRKEIFRGDATADC